MTTELKKEKKNRIKNIKYIKIKSEEKKRVRKKRAKES